MEVRLTGKAEKEYEKLNQPILDRINDGLDGLEKEPPVGDIRPLKGQHGIFRLKVGGYRILFYDRDGIRWVFRIAPRGGVYGRLK